MPSPLQDLLHTYRKTAQTEREKGTYFEELTRTYLRHEPTYKSLYEDVWLLAEVPDELGISKTDTGIDLVARTRGTGEVHAIQCKFYSEEYVIQRKDIDSFFTASGQAPFVHRLIVTTTQHWGKNAEAALENQTPPVSTIDLIDLEQSQIDWAQYQPNTAPTLKPRFSPRPHQQTAIDRVTRGLASAERGKLIMACGTGKTFTALRIAEQMAGTGKSVLFLVPSLALMSQSLTEWTQQSNVPLTSFAVCSDAQVGKQRNSTNDDIVETYAHELRYPATTNAARLAEEIAKRSSQTQMTVVFSTYHSLDVISTAQSQHGLGAFDLIICDEAHRTTGATFESEDESTFVRVHDNAHVQASKRLYMTATPRIYGNAAKARALQESIAICSMDDESLYGKELHVITFSEAVERGLLTDYKVIVLTIDEDHVSERLQDLLKDDNNQLRVDDAARIIGCWKALSKQDLDTDAAASKAMQRAVAFCQVIEPSKGRSRKTSSKEISALFQTVVDAYQAKNTDDTTNLYCEAEHVDGTMNASEKAAKINWLKADTPDNTCRILSNVRCLSEGVDVPALDAVLFMSPRNSQVDVVQSVGRVMRKAEGKDMGYVVLPVVIPHGMSAKDALDDNKIYRVVWDVLQALRSHDDRFDAFVNKVDLMQDTTGRMEVVAISDTLTPKPKSSTKDGKDGRGTFALDGNPTDGAETGQIANQQSMHFNVGELEKALHARLVKKCGNRLYWEEWASDIAAIAQTHISRITAIINTPSNTREVEAFNRFAAELRDDLNDSITDDEVIEMLAQHLITKPVFDALFADHSFASNNPVSIGMQAILDLLQEHRLDKEADTLEQFYASVRRRADGIDKAEGKQKIVVELYDKFFRNAFPRLTERLGIVYTPVEVVDFIIHSVNDILQEEFGQTLGSEGVHILDPFVGTGTFITRLMQSGLITPEQLPHKYKHEIHCNELVLLAYYIAAINIEAVYHGIVGGDYEPFDGILLTDTFQMYESDDQIEQFFPDNSERRKRQKALDIRVIVGNPPYSAGQESGNDNNQNVSYKGLDERIRTTYAAYSKATLKNALYDSYIRAIRWASDRVGKSGVVAYVTNAGFLEGNTAAGVRKCLAEEFDRICVFHLRGNQRTSGELSRQEGGKIFGSGSRAPIALTLFVKNSANREQPQIQWYEVGDYLTRKQKLEVLRETGSVQYADWTQVVPDRHFDWVNQRDEKFDEFVRIGDRKDNNSTVFRCFSNGMKSGRDAWCFNMSRSGVSANMQRMIDFYNSESERWAASDQSEDIGDFVNSDPSKISWNRALRNDINQGKSHEMNPSAVVKATYRPFTKSWAYFDRSMNDLVSLMASVFPSEETENVAIVIRGLGTTKDFSAVIVSNISECQLLANCQCFPLYRFEQASESSELFGTVAGRTDAISDIGLKHFRDAYSTNDDSITKEDLFYYIYGLLHSPDYRERYKDNLSKELPRIPAVKQFADFQAFSQAGRDLAHWHLNYETVDCHPVTLDFTAGDKGPTSLKTSKPEHVYVRKMKFGKVTDPDTGKKVNDKTTVIYNDYITVRDIPLDAYDYVVNGKPAIEWVMERQAVTTDKKSGIVNDANLWATETMQNARYPLELLMRVITVSLETNKIVNNLPALDIN